MKTRILHLLVLIIISTSASSQKHRESPIIILDYQYEYFWDLYGELWYESGYWTNPNRIDISTDDAGNITEKLVYNVETNENVERTLYSYDSEGKTNSITEQDWINSDWVNYRIILYTWDSYDRIIEFTVRAWMNDQWVNVLRRTDYDYASTGTITADGDEDVDKGNNDDEDRDDDRDKDSGNKRQSKSEKCDCNGEEEPQLLSYTVQGWTGQEWVDELIESYTYELDFITQRLITDMQGNFLNRYIYSFDDFEITNTYIYQNWIEEDWKDRVKRITYYNTCDRVISQIRQLKKNGGWQNIKKTDYFYTFQSPGKKVPVCHDGKTIWVSKRAVPAHIRHGDCIGECGDDYNRDCESKNSSNKKSVEIFTESYQALSQDIIAETIEEDLLNESFAKKSKDLDPSILLNENSLRIYPNPISDGVLKVRIDNDEIFSYLEIIDFSGRKLQTHNIKSLKEISINIEELLPGTYFIKAIGKTVAVDRLIVY